MNILYNIFKFLIGIIMAVFILAGAGVAAVLFLASSVTRLPERPTFPNDKTTNVATKKPVSQANSATNNNTSNNNQAEALAPGSYRAKVTEPVGLILRDTPSRDAKRLGGIAYEEELIVLEESSDKLWQRVKVTDGSDRTGWVSGGNTQAIE
jgi:hypothetical protein